MTQVRQYDVWPAFVFSEPPLLVERRQLGGWGYRPKRVDEFVHRSSSEAIKTPLKVWFKILHRYKYTVNYETKQTNMYTL